MVQVTVIDTKSRVAHEKVSAMIPNKMKNYAEIFLTAAIIYEKRNSISA